MDERVNRRMALKKVLSGGVDMLTHIFKTDSVSDVMVPDSDSILSPDQAGHLLRHRKTSKSLSSLNLNKPS